jgi:hypothetical protein
MSSRCILPPTLAEAGAAETSERDDDGEDGECAEHVGPP